jgi:hypothetical protein
MLWQAVFSFRAYPCRRFPMNRMALMQPGHATCTIPLIDLVDKGVNLVLQQYSFWLGIASLYLGFSAVLGTMLRYALLPRGQSWMRKMTVPYGVLLILPATVLILNLSEWEMLYRLGTVTMGLCVVFIALTRPRWMPRLFWLRTFGKIYLAGAMALSAIWGFSISLVTQTVGTTVIAAAAGMAGIASLWNALRPG